MLFENDPVKKRHKDIEYFALPASLIFFCKYMFILNFKQAFQTRNTNVTKCSKTPGWNVAQVGWLVIKVIIA